MNKIFKIMTAFAVLPIIWIAFVRIFVSTFKIDFENFLDDEDL
jgi:hypothetical protein